MSYREQLQAAIDGATGPVQLGPGVYDIDLPPSVGGRPRPLAAIRVGNVELRGAGQGVTTLRFSGDCQERDLYCLELTGGSISDLTIETSGLTNMDPHEQTHAIHVTGPSIGARVQRVTFDHPKRATKCGDGVRVLGYPGLIAADVLIADCTFLRCARSGVASHSGAHGLTIQDCKFVDIGDQDIDGEGSGGHRDWVIARNDFFLAPGAQGDWAIQLHKVDGVRVTENRFLGRGMFLLSARYAEVDDNIIVRVTAAEPTAVIQIDKASEDVYLLHNAIVRMASAGPGPVIKLMPRDGVSPSGVRIHRNSLTQACAGNIIDDTGVVGLDLYRNTTFAVPAVGQTPYGLHVQGAPTQCAAPTTASDNVWLGPLAGCVGVNAIVSSGYAGVGPVTLTGNVAMGPFGGLRVGNRQPSSGPFVSSGNHWPPAVGLPPGTETP